MTWSRSGYIAWSFDRTAKWTALLWAGVAAEACLHEGIDTVGLLITSALAWLVLFTCYLSDDRNKQRYWREKAALDETNSLKG